MSTNEHIMTITDGVPVFTCTFDTTADCHQYPDCECESWTTEGHEHPSSAHDACYLADWYKRPEDTAEMFIEDGSMMPENASGPIDIEWDEFPLWYFEEAAVSL
jgi:hypothetical protein